MSDTLMILLIAAGAAIAAPLGGAFALWHRPTTLLMSCALGLAGGVLLATFAFEMLPNALEHCSLLTVIAAFCSGFAAIYAFDLFMHRGMLAGAKAQERGKVRRFHRSHPPLGNRVTVLAVGTAVEGAIEGLTIGVALSMSPQAGWIIAIAVLIDDFTEGLSLGELVRAESRARWRTQARRIMGWTGLIGAAVFCSTLVGTLLLRGLHPPILGFLFGIGAGGLFYLTVVDLVPEAAQRQYQQLSAVAMGVGFLAMFALSAAVEHAA
ncbi:MAG: ZIP family metal transporter [Alphaproteobacteria bacterium]|nr:ZIP family metal transporter [Alphaproteobacteria bacterium]